MIISCPSLVSRQQFHEMTQDLLDRTSFTTRQTLQAANLEWKDIDRVLLVGGSTRMPAVYEMLKEMSGMDPDRSVSPARVSVKWYSIPP